MSETPEYIWIDLCAVEHGDEGFHVTFDPENVHHGYIHEDVHEAILATNRELVAQIAKMHSDYGPVIEQVNAQVAAIKREDTQ